MTSPPDELARVLQEIGTPGGGVRTLALRLCRLATARVPVQGAGVSLIGADGVHGIVAATDGPAQELEELQFTTGEGPCIDSARSGRAVLEPDLESTGPGRWPGFGPAALDLGVRAVFAFPLQVGAARFGALDLYRGQPGQLNDAALARALVLADAATLVLLAYVQHSGDGDLPLDGLLGGDGRRNQVHQATGMISVQLGVSLGDALSHLRAYAYADGRPVSEVAAEVVERRLRFGIDDNGDITTDIA